MSVYLWLFLVSVIRRATKRLLIRSSRVATLQQYLIYYGVTYSKNDQAPQGIITGVGGLFKIGLFNDIEQSDRGCVVNHLWIIFTAETIIVSLNQLGSNFHRSFKMF